MLPLALALLMTVDRPFAALVDPLFMSCEKPAGRVWEWVVTPPLPSEWPLGAKGHLVQYAYARQVDPSMTYAERQSGVFARVDVPKSGEAKATLVAQKIEMTGAQATHPLSVAEADAQRKVYDAAPHLWAGELDAVRVQYCTWIKNNGGIVTHVQDAHQPFFKALGCR
jgi:hypothetical protein